MAGNQDRNRRDDYDDWDGGGRPNDSRPRERPAPPPAPPLPAPIIITPLDVFGTRLMRPEQSPEVDKIVPAIIGVMTRVRDVPKLGTNKSEGYAYVKSADLSARVQDAIVNEGLAVLPRQQGEPQIIVGTTGKVLLITFQLDLWHVSGQFIKAACEGSGSARLETKAGVLDDKSVGKAITYALKSLTIAMFRIPTDADQDIERDDLPVGGNGNGNGNRRNDDRDRDRPRDDDRRDDRRNDDRRDDRRNDDRRDDGRDERRDDRARDDRPRDDDRRRDDPPFEGRQASWGGRAENPADADFNENCRLLTKSLSDAVKLEDADRIWTDNANLLRQMDDNRYGDFLTRFEERWKQNPPSI